MTTFPWPIKSYQATTRRKNVSIDSLVEKIINGQIDDNQFENADITLKDITKVKKLYKKKLQSIHHLRVEY